MKKEDLLKLIVKLFELKSKTYTQTTLTCWIDELQGYPDDKLKLAFQKVCDTPGSFPDVALIKKNMEPDFSLEAQTQADEVIECIVNRIKLPQWVYSVLPPGGTIKRQVMDNDFEKKVYRDELIKNLEQNLMKENKLQLENNGQKQLEGVE